MTKSVAEKRTNSKADQGQITWQITAILHAFDQDGLAIITQVGRGGSRSRLTPAQQGTIVRIADEPPYELGLPYGRWSLAKLRDYLIRQAEKRGGIHLRRVERKLRSRDQGFSPRPGRDGPN